MGFNIFLVGLAMSLVDDVNYAAPSVFGPLCVKSIVVCPGFFLNFLLDFGIHRELWSGINHNQLHPPHYRTHLSTTHPSNQYHTNTARTCFYRGPSNL